MERSFDVKNKLRHIARLSVRSDAVEGGSIPEDEVQLDFCISNNDVDSYGSIMTEKTLRNYAEDAARGVPFMRDHENGTLHQLGRTIAATYDEAKKQVNATVRILRDTDDTPENLRVNEYVRRIERSMYDSVSVGFKDADEDCNLCGKGIYDFERDDPCPHIPNRKYPEGVCTYNVDNARLREVSLVASGSNPNAKLLNRAEWSEELRKIKKDTSESTDQKSLLEREGEKWRATLIDAAIKEGVRGIPDFDETLWRERLSNRESGEIIDQTDQWKALGDARWGKGGRKTTETPGQPNTPATIIHLPSRVFDII